MGGTGALIAAQSALPAAGRPVSTSHPTRVIGNGTAASCTSQAVVAAIYTDGDLYTVKTAGTVIAGNHANEGGGAVFFVSNDRTGTLRIGHSTLRHNVSAGFGTPGYPGIFFLGAGQPVVIASSLS